MKYSVLSSLALIGLAGALLAPPSKADPVYKRTEVTFHQPVEIPGMVLTPGTYVMKVLDPILERNVVRFYNAQENHLYAMVFAIPDYRTVTTDRTVIRFEERAHDSPQAIKEWFPAGDNWGEEFIYPKAHQTAAAAPAAPPPLQPRPQASVAPAKPAETPAPAAQAQPSKAPVEIAQAQPAPSTQSAAPPAENKESPKKELPKTGSDLPLAALCGAAFVLAGAILRRTIA